MQSVRSIPDKKKSGRAGATGPPPISLFRILLLLG